MNSPRHQAENIVYEEPSINMIYMGMGQDLGELPLAAPQMVYDLRQTGYPQKIDLNDQARVEAEVERLMAPRAIRGQRLMDEFDI